MKRLFFVLFIILLATFACCNTVNINNSETNSTISDSTNQSDSTEVFPIKKPNLTWNDDNILKVLCIGNSFSQDTLAHAESIAKDLGINKVKFANMMIGGCDINTHASHARSDKAAYIYEVTENGTWTSIKNQKLSTALVADNWDYISLQQASGQSGMENRYGNSFTFLINYVKERMPENTQIVWNMTWAYQSDSTHTDFAIYNKCQSEMYKRIVDVTKSIIYPKHDIIAISPAGTAIQNARTSSLGDTLTRDGFHLSLGVGRFIAGLTFIHTLTGIEIDGVNFSISTLTEKEKQIAIKSVKAAINTPFEIVEIDL